jgi:putative acetyltransferase
MSIPGVTFHTVDALNDEDRNLGADDEAIPTGAAIATVFTAARVGMRYLPTLHTPAEDIAFFSERVLPECVVRAAALADRIIGFSAVREDWLDHLYVHPDWQGQGVGGQLLGHAQDGHPDGLYLWVFEENTRAVAFYQRAGFIELLRTDGRDNEECRPDIKMRWPGTGMPA